MKKKPFIVACIVLALLLAVGASCIFLTRKEFCKEVTLEAGTSIDVAMFYKGKNASAKILNDELPEVPPVGEYTVKVKAGILTHKSKLVVRDTVAPVGHTADCTVLYKEGGDPESFFVSVKDESDVTAAYMKQPDWTKTGRQKVELILTDAYANYSKYEADVIVRGVVKEIKGELGNVKLNLNDLALCDDTELEWAEKPNWNEINAVGSYGLFVTEKGERYEVTYIVSDTEAPKVTGKTVTGWVGKSLEPDVFVETCTDADEVTYSFTTEPDYTKEGSQDVSVTATDGSGNQSVIVQQLFLEKDTTPPVISGLEDRTVYIGDGVAYKKNITVTDNADDKPKLEIDTSGVDLNTVGDYTVVYVATDYAGNSVTETINLRVEEEKYSEASIAKMAEEVLAEITTEEMTDREVLTAIYTWLHSNFRYYSYSDMNSWTKSAYYGFTKHKGDCFVFTSVAQALLTSAGIKNMIIWRIPGTFLHYWNIVDIGEGWYHFDTTPRLVKHNFDYIGDDELMAYSIKNDKCHHYDRALFPEIQKE